MDSSVVIASISLHALFQDRTVQWSRRPPAPGTTNHRITARSRASKFLTIQGLLDGTERPHWPDLSFGEQNFKKAKAAGKNTRQKGLFEE